MPQWETVDKDAEYPDVRYRWASDSYECRIFYRTEGAREGMPWILAVRELWRDGPRLIHLGNYSSVQWAKLAAQAYEHPPSWA